MKKAKDSSRLSFSMDKVATNKFIVGPSGITATTASGAEPTEEPEYNDIDGFTSTELLYRNIDKLGESLSNKIETAQTFNQDEDEEDYPDQEEDYIEEDEELSLNGLTEEEVILNLDYHLGLANIIDKKSPKTVQIRISTKNDNFCRNCGVKFNKNDNFCPDCGNQRG